MEAMQEETVYRYVRKSGTCGLHGELNEVKLLMIFLAEGLEAKRNGTLDRFFLGSNVESAMDFDDVVFKYIKTDGTSKVVVLQAKHRLSVEAKMINPAEVSINGDYSLRRYLNSFIEAKKNFSEATFDDQILKNTAERAEFVFFTNVGLKDNRLPMKELAKHEFLSFIQNEDFKGKDTMMRSCKVDTSNEEAIKDIFDALQQPVDFLKLVNDLVKAYKQKESYTSSEIFKKYKPYMMNRVFEISKESCRLKKDFLDLTTSDESAIALRNAFIKELLMKFKKKTEENLIEELKNLDFRVTTKVLKDSPNNNECTDLKIEINKNDIKEFLDKFLFFVNQPGEAELEEIIKQKIHHRFPQISEGECGHIFSYVCEKIFAWWRNVNKNDEKNVQVDYITERNDYFKEAKDHLSSLKLVSNLSSMISKLNKDLIFLRDSYEELIRLIDEQTTIGIAVDDDSVKMLQCLKLRQALDESKYKSEPYYVVNASDNLECISNSFYGFFRLLIIELHHGTHVLSDLCAKLEAIVESDQNKRIIIMGEECAIKNLNIKIEIWNDRNIGFAYLCGNSQRKLLDETRIVFLDRPMLLMNIMPERWYDYQHLIDGPTLAKITSGPYSLGSAPKDAGFFIPRKLERRSVVSKSCFSDCRFRLAVSGLTPQKLDELREEYGRTKDDLLGADEELDQDRPLHSLKYEHGNFYWIKSSSDVSQIKQHIDNNELVQDIKPEDVKDHTKIIAIAADPGMGKSKLLINLADNCDALWRIKINLDDHSKQFQDWLNEKTEIDQSVALNFLVDALKLTDTFGKELLGCHFNVVGNISVFMDGFDEICPSHGETVVKLIKAIEKSKAKKIWISTRLYSVETLENATSVLPYTIMPFSAEDQKEFLKKIWKTTATNESKTDSFIDAMLRSISEAVDDGVRRLEFDTHPIIDLMLKNMSVAKYDEVRQFARVPLHLQMLGEKYEQECENFLRGGKLACDESTFEHCPRNLYDFYEKIIKTKFFKIWKGDKLSHKIETNGQILSSEREYSIFEKEHSEMAFLALFTKDQLGGLFSPRELIEINKKINEIAKGREKHGIINEVINGRPIFIHRTYPEYFVSKMLADNMLNDGCEAFRSFILSIGTFKLSKTPLRNFFDLSLSERRPLLEAIMAGDIKKIENITERDAFTSTDAFGRSPLHMAVFYSNVDVIKAILNKCKDNIESADELDECTPVMIATHFKNWAVLNLLLSNGANLQEMEIFTDDMKLPSLWYETISRGNLKLAKIILKKRPELIHPLYGYAPLILAVEYNQVEIVELLLSCGVDVLQESYISPGYTSLHACSDDTIFNKLRPALVVENVDVLNMRKSTPLHLAAGRGQYNMVKELLILGADIEAVDEHKNTPLHHAVLKGSFEVVKLLKSRGARMDVKNIIDLTPAEMALPRYPELAAIITADDNLLFVCTLETNDLTAVKSFLDQRPEQIDLLFKDETPLHIAARRGYLDMARYLLERGADIGVYNSHNMSPLHTATIHRQLDVMELLRKHGAKPTDSNSSGWSTLHSVAELYTTHMMQHYLKTLPGKEQWINQRDIHGTTLLHVAAYKPPRYHEMFDLILENGADCTLTNSLSCGPALVALIFGNEKVCKKILTRLGASYRSRLPISELHVSVAMDRINLVKWLVEDYGVEVDVGESATALHVAVAFKREKTVKYLISKGANTKAIDEASEKPYSRALEKSFNEARSKDRRDAKTNWNCLKDTISAFDLFAKTIAELHLTEKPPE